MSVEKEEVASFQSRFLDIEPKPSIDGNGTEHDLVASSSGVVEAVRIMKMNVAVSGTSVSTFSIPASAEIIEVLIRVNGAYAATQTMTISHDGNIIVPSSEINLQVPNVYAIKTLHLTSNPSIISVTVTGITPGPASCDVIVKFATNFLT